MATPKKQPKKVDAPPPQSNKSISPKGKPPKPPAKPASQAPRTVIEPLEDRQHI